MVSLVLSVWFVPVVTREKAVTVLVAMCASNCVPAVLFGTCRRTRIEQRCAFTGCLLRGGDRGGWYRRELCGLDFRGGWYGGVGMKVIYVRGRDVFDKENHKQGGENNETCPVTNTCISFDVWVLEAVKGVL